MSFGLRLRVQRLVFRPGIFGLGIWVDVAASVGFKQMVPIL